MLVINRGSFLESKKPRRLRPGLQGWFEIEVSCPVGRRHAASNQVYVRSVEDMDWIKMVAWSSIYNAKEGAVAGAGQVTHGTLVPYRLFESQQLTKTRLCHYLCHFQSWNATPNNGR